MTTFFNPTIAHSVDNFARWTVASVLIVVFGSTVFLAGTVAHAQADTSAKKNMFVIKTDFLLPVIGQLYDNTIFSLTLEKGFKTRHSFQLTGLFSNLKTSSGSSFTNFIFEDYKFFWRKEKSFTGFYSGINGQEIFEGGKNGSNNTRIGGGLIIGYQNYIRRKLTIDALFGLTWGYLVQKTGNSILRTVNPYGRAAINIGYRF